MANDLHQLAGGAEIISSRLNAPHSEVITAQEAVASDSSSQSHLAACKSLEAGNKKTESANEHTQR